MEGLAQGGIGVEGLRVGGLGGVNCLLRLGSRLVVMLAFSSCVFRCWEWVWCRVCRKAAVAWGSVFAKVRGLRVCWWYGLI